MKPSTAEQVKKYIEELEHPLKKELLTVRAIILQANPAITECIKWNTLSYYCNGDFATFHPREQNCVQLILHNGAKVKNTDLKKAVKDEANLLQWLAKDRATIKLTVADIDQHKAALAQLINDWIAATTSN
jgi:hypothetical protein